MRSISQRFALPTLCHLCHVFHRGKTAICTACKSLLQPLEQTCPSCAIPLADKNLTRCNACRINPPAVDHIYTAYRFEEPLRKILHRYKYHGSLFLTSFLADILLDATPPDLNESTCLIPVPMHRKRLQQRGFNHAVELTKYLAKHLSIACELHECKKIIHTETQAQLSATQRKYNVKKTFTAKTMPYQRIILIDDIVTTGQTVNALAEACKVQGNPRVDVWCCARVIAHE